VLKTALEDCAKLGLIYNVGPELEFFLFKTDATASLRPTRTTAAGYFDVSTDMASHIRRHMVRALASFGIEVERYTTKSRSASTRSTSSTARRCARPTTR